MTGRASGAGSSSRDGARDGARDGRLFKKPRGSEARGGGAPQRPLTYCEYHRKQVCHTAAECYLRRRPSESGK